MKTVPVLGGTADVFDTFEVRAPKDIFFDIGMAFAEAKRLHPELGTICLLSTRFVDADDSDVGWQDPANTETVWTFKLPYPGTVAAEIRSELDLFDVVKFHLKEAEELRDSYARGTTSYHNLELRTKALTALVGLLDDPEWLRRIQTKLRK